MGRPLYPSSTIAKKYRTLLITLLLLVLASGAGFSQNSSSSLPSAAPLNPDFVQHWSAVAQAVKHETISTGGHRLGHVPSPVDFSHLAEQLPVTQLTADSLPSSYDLRTANRVTPVRDQGQCGACWAFAAFGSEESALMPGENRDFSENNLKNLNGFDGGPCAGGNGMMSSAYLARWGGPVNESADPYTYNTANPNATTSNSPAGLPVQKHVQDINVYPAIGYPVDQNKVTTLKNAVIADGALHTSMYMDDVNYYSGDTNAAYYYAGTLSTNHDVTLVGWDDNFDKSKFKVPPPGNGAYLIKNSWGTGWGQAGYFWISYYDMRFATKDQSYSYPGNQVVTNYARKYEYDPLGLVTYYGYGSSSIGWFANVFPATATEQLAAVSFWVASNGASYTINVYTNVTAKNPTSGTLVSTTSGTVNIAGYHTLTLTTPVLVTNQQNFSVVVQVNTPGTSKPIPMELAQAGYSSQAKSSPGQSFMSQDGNSWLDATNVDPSANICLKAFTVASAGNFSLTVNSTNPGGGVAITVSPADINSSSNGTTSFTRTYSQGTVVQLTAPSAYFSSWTGCDSVNGTTCTVTVNAAKIVTANYVGYVVTVKSSSPPYGISITASPADLNGSTGGSTAFTLAYYPGTVVTLTAPTANFYSWTGCDSVNGNVCTVSMSVSKSVTANFTGMPRVVTLPARVGASATATVNGKVVPNGIQTQYRFEYGTKENLSKYKQTTWQTLSAGISESAAAGSLSALTAKTLYYYRLVGKNSAGTSQGQILSFRSGAAQGKTSSSPEDDEATSSAEASPTATPAEAAIHTAPSPSSPSVVPRNANPGTASGTTGGTQLATLEVTPSRNAPLVVKLGDLAVGALTYTACAGLPEGATCSYDDHTQTMTITPAANTPPGSYPVSVTFAAEPEEE